MQSPIYKLVVLGEGRVGKTSVSLKFTNNEFSEDQQSTVNASYLQKKVSLENHQVVKLAIWDTAGQEKYNAIAPVYYRQAVGAIVVYQITSRESFEKVKKWVSQLEDHAPRGIILTIAGNKADLQSKRAVNNNQVEKFAKMHNANHFVVSAKNGMNVKQMFGDIAQRIYDKNQSGKVTTGRMRNNPKISIEVTDNKSSKKKKDCCK